MPATLDQVLATAERDAEALRRHGDARAAAALERVAAAVRASEDAQLLAWLSERRATTRSGHDVRWFKRRRAEWAAAGLARETAAGWEYRSVVVPQRAEAGDDPRSEAERLLGGRAA